MSVRPSISFNVFAKVFFSIRMQSLPNERKRNQRKSPLTPKKSFRKEDSPPAIAMRVGGRVKVNISQQHIRRSNGFTIFASSFQKAKIPFDPSDAVTKRRQTDSCVGMKRITVGKDSPGVQYSCCHCKKIDKRENFVNCKGDCATKSKFDGRQSVFD